MKRRIAILTNYPADLKSFTGGVETATRGLLDGLKRYQDEFEFHIISLSKMVNRDLEINQDGYSFHFLAVPKNPLFKPHLPYNIIKVLLKLKELKPDLIHCQDNMALAVAAILGGYLRIFTIHGIKRMEAKLWKGKEYLSHQMDRILEWYVHRHFKYFIAISPYVSNLLGNRKMIFNIPNPISKDFFAFHPHPVSNGENRFLLFIGPIVYLKQIHILIQAFIKLKGECSDLKLIICGAPEDEKYYNWLQRMIEKNKTIGITFIEHLPRDELKEYIKKAFALVLPSRQENSPMTIAEAMALGTPVIASCAGGIPYMIEHKKTGLLFKPEDSDGLANCITMLLKDNLLREKIIRNANWVARKMYNPEEVAKKTVKVYKLFVNRGLWKISQWLPI